MMICGNTGVIAGSELCGFCVARGCEGYKTYHREHKKKVSSFDDKDIVGYEIIDEDDDCSDCSDCESYECYKNGIHSICPKEKVWDYCKKADDEWNER